MVEPGPELAAETKLEGDTLPTAQAQPPEESQKLNGVNRATPEELVARSIAPIKSEFLCSPPNRSGQQNGAVARSDENVSHSGLAKEKKSKRQLKLERRQNRLVNLCPAVAKTGDISSCPYKDKCRFNHDLEAFKAQKEDDIEGECPFTSSGTKCLYGLACRFWGTHRDDISMLDQKESSTVNALKKDVQKLLWKNKLPFPRSEAILISLGLLGNSKSKRKVSEDNNGEKNADSSNGSHSAEENGLSKAVADSLAEPKCISEASENVNIAEAEDIEEPRPPKKAKPENEESICLDGIANGSGIEVTGKENESCPEKADVDDANNIELVETERNVKIHPREKKKLIDFREKLYLAPLTTVGNLPFRRVCKVLGADVTCGEMAMCVNLLQGQASEWALLRRHSSEDLFGVQICGSYPDTVTRVVELIDQECTVDFIDINMGCPIDIVVNRGAGSALLNKPQRMKSIIEAASRTVDTPITVKVRMGYFEGKNRVDSLIEDIGNWGATALTIHGRSRQQRYSKLADWNYIYQCARKAPSNLQVLGNGDVFSYLDWNKHKSDCPELSSCMIARGALIKPWIFTEIKEQRHWDISSGERLNILKDYVRFGLQHWGSDSKGVETTRHFLLEWLSYTHRYIPVGLLDVIPQCLNWRPPSYYCRDDLETLMASDSAADWIRISEMLLGKVPGNFEFAPKHKSNAYDRAENG